MNICVICCYIKPFGWGRGEQIVSVTEHDIKGSQKIWGCCSPSVGFHTTSEYDQEMPQSETNPRHREEETQNTDSQHNSKETKPDKS